MRNFLPPSNTLYRSYQSILTQLILLVPHNDFLEGYIASNFFPWKEHYFEQSLRDFKSLALHSNEQTFFKSKIFTSNDYSSEIKKTEEILKDIPPKTIKISVTDKNINSIHPFSPLEAKYDKEKNILSLSTQEENLLNNGHFKKEVFKRFDTIKGMVETFYQDNKSKHKTTLKECFIQLSNFVIKNEDLKLAYKTQPKLVQENLDLLGFKDFNETSWQDLKMFIEEKKIILNNLSNSKTNSTKLSSEGVDEVKEDFPDIFKSYECYLKFINVAEGIGIDFENTGKRGFKVRFWALWDNKSTRKYFKTYMLKKDYAIFLNDNYEGNYNSKNTFDTYKYVKLINDYLKSK